MATSVVRAEQRTVTQFCFESGMTPLDTSEQVKQVECYKNVTQALAHTLFSRVRDGKPATERMGRSPLRNTGNVPKVISAVSDDRRHMVPMFREPDHRNLSMKLSEVLDEIGVNEKVVLKGRRVSMLRETMGTILHRLTGDNCKVYCLGSQSEGTTTKGLRSDFDILYCDFNVNVIQDCADWKPYRLNLLMIKDEITSPGYCFLQLLRSDVPLHVTEIPHESFIKDRRGRILWGHTWLNGRIQGTERHGPSQAIQGVPGYSDRDLVFAYPCTSWPQSAAGWLDRQGIGRWPTPEMKRYAVSSKCFVVPVGRSDSAHMQLEWRISTSLAERCLMFNLNITQLRCYVLLKMVIKTFLNPKGENNLSSFMCKTVLLHCIEKSESNVWQEHNLFICLIFCLLELHTCIQSDHCPHFIIPENNLMAGQFLPEVKHQLLQRISDFIQSDGRALLRIHIDDLGHRLQIKLNVLTQLAYILPSPAEVCGRCSGFLYFNLAKQICVNHTQILRKTDGDNTETIKQYIYKIINYSQHGNRQEQASCRFLAPFLCTTLGSVLASTSICQNNTMSPETLFWLSAGLNSDVSSSRLKLASVFYCIGDMEKAEFILKHTERQYNSCFAIPICSCWEHPCGGLHEEFNRICNEQNEHCIKHISAFCVRYLQSEIHCVPRELQYEMFRSTQDDRFHRVPYRDKWMDWAVVDSLPYLYFLQFKTYGHLHRYQDQQHALTNLLRTIEMEQNLGHKETALNLLGQCLEQENRPQHALHCYMLSLNERDRNNAAKFHICHLLATWVTQN